MKLALALAVLLAGHVVHAGTRRIALLVGSNIGVGDRPPLHYAESDAEKLAETLAELGGVERTNLFLLQGATPLSVYQTLDAVQERVRAWHAENNGTHVVLIFFFSGHSDGESLELGSARLSFADLRRRLANVGADVRVAIIDSCKSGALLASKGGRAGPAFAIRLTDDVASSGEALLTSSAADEAALESREIRSSFFTHHLVSGLRGAADLSHDGRVTLGEIYQYAFARTVSSTANTTIGPQHPGYDYRLSGEGDLVLSDLSQRTAAIDLPSGFDRILVHEQSPDQVLAEIPGGVGARVAVPPGNYAIRAWRAGQTLVAQVSLNPGELRTVKAEDLRPTAPPVVLLKGGDQRRQLGLTLVAGVGVEGGVTALSDVHGAVRVGVSSARPSGWKATLLVSSGRGAGFSETTTFALGGYRLGLERSRFRAYGAVEAGVGLVAQDVDAGRSFRTASVAGAPEVGASVRLTRTLAIGVEVQLLVGWLRKDGGNAALVLPAGWAGLYWTL
ncbi:MAG TPA: caspase family protein [Polyangia bacterium]|nr:caspase family protein [Polyangia bacterium]